MFVAVLVWKNVEFNFCDVSLFKILLLQYSIARTCISIVAVAVVDDDDEDDENDDDNINAEEADIDGNGSSVSISCSSSSSSSIGLGGGGRRQQGWTDVDKDYCDGEVMMVRRRGTPTGTYEGEDKENY